MTTIHVQATDGTDFYRQVATFAYASSIQNGFGAVVVTEGEFRTYGDGRVEASLEYVPYSLDADLPSEVNALIWDYDPERECVLAMVNGTGEATCVTLTAGQTGATPTKNRKVQSGAAEVNGRSPPPQWSGLPLWQICHTLSRLKTHTQSDLIVPSYRDCRP